MSNEFDDILKETESVESTPVQEVNGTTLKSCVVPTPQKKEVAVAKNVGEYVNNTMMKYMEQGLVVPKDYNVQNAVISSYMIISQDDKLKQCDQKSIINALLDMATLGLNVAKNQAYFIPYGNQAKLSISYFGKIMAIKRIRGVIDVRADVIYKDTGYELTVDEFGNDDIKITSACPLDKRNFDNLEGAWCKIILDKDVWGSSSYCTIMNMDQIHKAWLQGASKANSPAHKNFTDEMAKKTVINRCCKTFVNSAKDNDIFIETLNRVTENDYNDEPRVVPYGIDEKKVIDI